MPIDFVKLWREAEEAEMLLDVGGHVTSEQMAEAAASVLEQAFAAAVEECAKLAESHAAPFRHYVANAPMRGRWHFAALAVRPGGARHCSHPALA